MDTKKYTQRLLQVLREERARHGHGAAAEIDQRLGRAEGYLGRVLRGEVGLQMEMLFHILEVLGSDPGDFFARVVGTHQVDPECLLTRLERHNASVRDPRLEKIEALMKIRFEGREVGDDLDLLHQRLGQIDELRFFKPLEAHHQVADALDRAIGLAEGAPSLPHLELLCHTLGVKASIDRVHARFPAAARALRLALSWARHHRWHSRRARLLQRTCYLVSDQGDYGSALELTRQAGDLYVQLDDRVGIGKSLVDRGIMLGHLDRRQDAIKTFERSLVYLPESEWQCRFSVFQGIGQIFIAQGRLEDAWEQCTRAMQIHRTQEGPNWWRLVWLQGEIELARNVLESAVEKLSAVRQSFNQHGNPFDLALVSLRLAKALFLLGKNRDVQSLAAEMISLLKPLRKHKIASASIHELAKAALMGRVTLALLDGIYVKIQKEPFPRLYQ